MKHTGLNIIFALLLALISTGADAANEIKVEGIFKGQNIFVANPFAASGVGFCIYEITVNGVVTMDELNRSGFEIDLSQYHLAQGDPVVVVIKHKDGCTPKVLNPEVLKPQSSYTVVSMKVDKTGRLTFSTKEERGALPFVVEQFKWKKWTAVAQVQGKGTPSLNNYSVTIPLHSGINKLRLKQVDCTKKPRYSSEVTYNNLMPEVTFKPGNNGQTTGTITFSRGTEYEIYDFYGQRMAKGHAASVNVSSYPKGTYFINYDCKSESFEKK